MTNKIEIDIVSDVVCPWCIVGYKRLEKAIQDLGMQEQVSIEWQPFELNQQMPAEGQDLQEHIAEKYGSTEEQQNASRQHLVAAGKELGFTFDFFDGMRIVNTFEAHILLDYAIAFGKQTELKLSLIKAYFSDRKDVSNRDVLKQILVDAGLNAEEALLKLDDADSRMVVKQRESLWQRSGVNSVPTIVFNKKSAVTGAQAVDVFKEVLQSLKIIA